MIYGNAVSYMQIKSPIKFPGYFNYFFMAQHNFTRKVIYAQLHSGGASLRYLSLLLSLYLSLSFSLPLAFSISTVIYYLRNMHSSYLCGTTIAGRPCLHMRHAPLGSRAELFDLHCGF